MQKTRRKLITKSIKIITVRLTKMVNDKKNMYQRLTVAALAALLSAGCAITKNTIDSRVEPSTDRTYVGTFRIGDQEFKVHVPNKKNVGFDVTTYDGNPKPYQSKK